MKFKKGDEVFGRNFINALEYNGMQGFIYQVGPSEAKDIVTDDVIQADYRVQFADGRLLWVYESNLRKRRPPEEPAVTKLKQDIDMWVRETANV
jgi:hypothetical protein